MKTDASRPPSSKNLLPDSAPRVEVNPRQLHRAVRANDLEAVRTLLAADGSLVAHKADGQTPLHEASAYASVEMVRLLLAHDAPINATGYNGFTPLHVAQNAATVIALVEAGANLGHKNSSGKTPLQGALRRQDDVVAGALIEAGAPIDLASAIMLGDLQLARRILANDPASANTEGRSDLWGNTTPLGLAASTGDIELIELMIEASADVNSTTWVLPAGGQATPLCNAVWAGHADVVELLLERGAAPVGVGGKFFDSILDFAVQHSEIRIVDLLVSHGAVESEMCFAMRRSPLASAALSGEGARVRLFLPPRMDFFDREELRRALFVAALADHEGVVDILKAAGAVPDLFISAALGDTDTVSAAIDRDRALVHAYDALTNRSLLCWCIVSDRSDLVRLLVDLGANVNEVRIRRAWGSELLEGTPRPGWQGVATYAEEAETPLLAAIRMDDLAQHKAPNTAVVRLLLKHGANPNHNIGGETPIDAAQRVGADHIIDELRSYAANADRD